MKAYVFSIGEETTYLCCSLMQENGFEVILYKDQTTLWDKLRRFYTEALETDDDQFIRIDADVIPNRNISKLGMGENNAHWVCASGFDFYKQDLGAISIHRMSRWIITNALKYIDDAEKENRPESYVWRVPSINHFTTIDKSYCYGMHGFGQKDHRERIKALKSSRDQNYDWDLIDRLEKL